MIRNSVKLAASRALHIMVIFPMFLTWNQLIPARKYEIAPQVPMIVSDKVDVMDKAAVVAFVKKESLAHGVNPQMAVFIMGEETDFRPDVFNGKILGDTHLICREKKSPNFGKPQRARGPYQINDCYNWDVSDEVAFDLERSTAWAMPVMSVHPERWSTYKKWLAKNEN